MTFLLTSVLVEAFAVKASASMRKAASRPTARSSRSAFWTLPLLLSAVIAMLCFYAALHSV